jgi:hypothetical protein
MALSSTKVYTNERMKPEMRNLYILCVGGRGQPMLAGRSGGGGYIEPKPKKLKK